MTRKSRVEPSDDTRALRDALEETQGALRAARQRIKALEDELARVRAPARPSSDDLEPLRQHVAELNRELLEARTFTRSLELAHEERGRRILALSAEMDRLRARALAAENATQKAQRTPSVRAPKPPAAPAGATHSATRGHANPDPERVLGDQAKRPNLVRPLEPGRVIINGEVLDPDTELP